MCFLLHGACLESCSELFPCCCLETAMQLHSPERPDSGNPLILKELQSKPATSGVTALLPSAPLGLLSVPSRVCRAPDVTAGVAQHGDSRERMREPWPASKELSSESSNQLLCRVQAGCQEKQRHCPAAISRSAPPAPSAQDGFAPGCRDQLGSLSCRDTGGPGRSSLHLTSCQGRG